MFTTYKRPPSLTAPSIKTNGDRPTYRKRVTVTTSTSTRTAEAVDIILDAFGYWPGVPALTGFTDVERMRRHYEKQGGPAHWFDADALRFFGSRNRQMTQPGLLLETQTEAPEGVGRYSLTAWVYDTTNGDAARITPKLLGKFYTLDEARKMAATVHQVWGKATEAMRLREAGAPGGGEELLEVLAAL